MRIFIDESGVFTGSENISAVGALVVPDHCFKGFEKLFGRVRRKLPKENGEVKGRLLQEHQIADVVPILLKLGCLFEIVVVDSRFHTEEEINDHKIAQAENITKYLTDQHHQNMISQVWSLRNQLENMPNQLYVQSCAMSELVYNTIFNANIYYSFRLPKELGSYQWTIDAKGRDTITEWENWWNITIHNMIESKSFRKPFAAVEGGDYRWQEPFRTDIDEFKRPFIENQNIGDTFNLKAILGNNLSFSNQSEIGLEAVDILVNAVRRSLAGNFNRRGWLPIRQIMIHNKQHYVRFVSLAKEIKDVPRLPYMKVLSDFESGGRAMLPQGREPKRYIKP